VLEQVRQPGVAGRILRRADPVAHVDRHQVGAIVGDHRDLHAVGQLEQLDVVAEIERATAVLEAPEVGIGQRRRAATQRRGRTDRHEEESAGHGGSRARTRG
jgi:hypothetical protein